MHFSFVVLVVAFITQTVAQDVPFAADPSINARDILAAANDAQEDVLATFPSTQDNKERIHIYGDWLHLSGLSVIHFTAAMAVDCDGVDFHCPHNGDGQPQTSFGHLSAKRVPWYVLPETFFRSHSGIVKPNSLGAVICNGNMFYGIFADTNGDDPEVIGEASLLLAQTCFPDENLDGGTGHDPIDVLYLVFGQKVPSGVGDKTIDLQALKKLGDQQVKKLADAIGR